MNNWLIALFSGIGGIIITLFVNWFIRWWGRPRLVIDFEQCDNQKPYILDLFIEHIDLAQTMRSKFLRLIVRNIGRSPAINCEAKMVILKDGKSENFAPSMHWARRDPTLYNNEPNQIYAPIHLNRNDYEPLDIFSLSYRPEEPELGPGVCIDSMSHRKFRLERGIIYFLKVTIYARNTVSKPFLFTLHWDGTLAGFDNAVSKGWKDHNQNQSPISRREFLTTGMLFFLFSLTLYIFRAVPAVFTFWVINWQIPLPIWATTNVIIIIVSSIISFVCLIGSFFTNGTNDLLKLVTSNEKVMSWAKPAFVSFFSVAFFCNFYLSWVQKLVGVAKEQITFYIIFAVGLFWVWAIVQTPKKVRG